MKRIISFLILFSVMFSGVAYAANSYSIYDVVISYNPVKDSIDVSGFVNTSKTELMMVLKVEKDGVIVETKEFFATDLVNENLYFKFEDIAFAGTAQEGRYEIAISSRYTPLSTHAYDYKGGNTLFETMKNIQTYTATNNFTELIRVIDENQYYLGIDNSFYTTLNSSELVFFKNVLLSKVYDLKDASEYDSDAEKKEAVQKEVADLISYYKEAMAVVEYGRITTSAKLDEWLSEYTDDIALNRDSTLYEYFNEVKGSNEFLEHLKANHTATNNESLCNNIYENVILTLIQTKYYTVAKELVESYEEYFDINKSNYNKLTAAKKAEAFSKLEGKFYKSAQDASDALDEYVLECLDNSSAGANKPEWGGGTGGGGALSALGSIVSKDNTNADEKVENLTGLTDLNDAQWAENAITYLHKNGVVSGYNNKFEPNANVTRAQFVKMVLLAAGKGADSKYEATFYDVSENDWYAPYVCEAMRLGIVKGDNEGRFNPDSFITRQDMAVIIYRAFNLGHRDGECALTDFELVSDYAKAAVKTLSVQKIINGYADGSFAPFNNATRAEAAQMLYNIIQ